MSMVGFYRATVVDNVDPMAQLRLKVVVPSISDAVSDWAPGCLPVGRKAVPKVGSTVWVAYERGDPNHPVWVGVLPYGPP